MDKNFLNLDWVPVEKALSEGTFSGYKIAVIETKKLLDKLMTEKNISDKRFLPFIVRLPEQIPYALGMYEKIIKEPGFEISREDTKEIIGSFWQIMEAVNELKPLALKEKIKLKYKVFRKK